MQYEVQYGRIATQDKLVDRFLNCQAKKSNDLGKSFMGASYTMVEILSPWFNSSQVGQSIANAFYNNYYEGASTSDLANFEEALKHVNENLAKVTQNGETNWIGNLNGILAVVVENKLHLAQTGKAEAYIFRDGKVNNITYGLSQNQIEPHPLKTFSNVTSGELKPHDKVLIANPELFNVVDLESIRQIVTLNSPYESALALTKLIKRKKNKNVNAIILELSTTNEISAQIAKDQPNTVYLDKQMDSYINVAIKIYKNYVLPYAKILGKHSKNLSKKSLTFTKSYVKTLQEKREKNEPVKKRDLFEAEFLSNEKDEGLLKDEEIKYSPELKIHYYEQEIQAKKGKNEKIELLLNLTRKTAIAILELFTIKKKRPYLLAIAALIIIVFLVSFLNANKGNGAKLNITKAQEILREAEKLQQDGQKALASNDKDKAISLLTQSTDKAADISDVAVVSGSAQDIIKNNNTKLDELTATKRFTNATALVNLPQAIKAFTVKGGYVYLVSESEIYKALISGGRTEKMATLPKNGGSIYDIAVINEKIFLATDQKRVYEFDLQKEKIQEVSIEGGWPQAQKIASYIGNLYFLNGNDGQIFKTSLKDNTFSPLENYINTKSVDLEGAKSLAIDGSVFVLKQNEAIKLSRAKLVDFNLSGILGKEITNADAIFTDADSPSIYILENKTKKIMEFDKDGNYLHQYIFDSIENINNFNVSIKSKKIYLTDSNNFYEFEL